MPEFTFTVYDTPLMAGGGTITFSSNLLNMGTLVVSDSGVDGVFHEDGGDLYTSADFTLLRDPEGQNDQVILSNTLNPAANGLTVHSAGHLTVVGSDGSEFIAFIVRTDGSSGNDPWGNTSGIFATTEPLVDGVEYSFLFPPNAGIAGSGGVGPNGGVAYSELACFVTGTRIEKAGGQVRVEDLMVVSNLEIVCKVTRHDGIANSQVNTLF